MYPTFVSRFVQFLANDDFPQLKHEAAWILTHMTEYERIDVLVDCDTVPLFVQLISSDNEEDQSLAVWALGNIARRSLEYRDRVLSCGALMTLLSQCDLPNPTDAMLTAAGETLHELFRWNSCPPLAQIEPALPVLERFLHSENSALFHLSSALLGHFFMRGDNDETRQALMDLGLIPRLVELFEHENTEIHETVVCTICAVLRSDNIEHSQVVIDQKPISGIASFLSKTENTVSKVLACYDVYQIAMWDQNQLEEVIASGVVQDMIPLLQDHHPDLTTWCVRTINRVTSGRNHEHISLLARHGCIEALCDTLASPVKHHIVTALKALTNILLVGKEEKNLVHTGDQKEGSCYAKMVIDVGGLEKINELADSQDKGISNIAFTIVSEFFGE